MGRRNPSEKPAGHLFQKAHGTSPVIITEVEGDQGHRVILPFPMGSNVGVGSSFYNHRLGHLGTWSFKH